ncbi:MAG TPA: NAD+ synthase [Chloroflexota bacterium]|nr:NAD+ synthase [Chloroflexota bacterium]
MRALRIGLAQLNPTVGDLHGNRRSIAAVAGKARDEGVELLVFPELALTGYPPEDLLLKPSFARANRQALEQLAGEIEDLWAVVGYVDLQEDLYNAAALIGQGRVAAAYHKRYLPNYGVFDEDRYFRAGSDCPLFVFEDVRLGVTICEDIWYPGGPAQWQAAAGAELVVNLSASPYHARKGLHRERMLATRASDYAVWLAYVNLVGGQDELVFDGQSMIVDPTGRVVASGRVFAEDLLLYDVDLDAVLEARLHEPRPRKLDVDVLTQPAVTHLGHIGDLVPTVERVDIAATLCRQGAKRPVVERHIALDDPSVRRGVWELAVERATEARQQQGRQEDIDLEEEVYAALVLGVRDYVRKNGVGEVVIGLSGGIDSSLVAVIACDALGKERVHGVAMPSRFNASSSEEDARQLAHALGIEFRVIPVEPVFEAFLQVLEPSFAGTQANVAEENIQARIRGSLWMALTNKFNWIALTAGNKSEMATGYATLYGDMAGGFAVLKDVPKTLVYRLARYRNTLGGSPVIPLRVLDKAPSAELRAEQKDQDSLPPYDELDSILEAYVEKDWDFAHLVSVGHTPETVQKVLQLVDRAEYKRRQAPPGIKITPRAFGRDRRLPITNRYREQPETSR